MKALSVGILSVSIIANILLAIAIVGRSPQASTAASPAVTTTTAADGKAPSTGPGDKQPADAAAASTTAPTAVHKPIAWADLYSTDMRQLAANLRAAGLSERMVFTIVAALVHQQSTAKIRDIMTGSGTDPFWKTGMTDWFDPQKQKQLSEINRAERELMTSLFGANSVNENDREIWQQRYGPLPPEKLQKLVALNEDYSQKMAESGSMGMGPQMPWEREQRAKLEDEKRKDIQALLTPDELQLYDQYSSMTGNTMRRQLTSFAPTQSEFDAIFQLKKAFDDKYNYNAPSADTQDFGMQRMTAQKELDAQIKATLGDTRYADYQRSVDIGFQTATNISRRLNLPPENATAVYALQQDFQQRMASARTLSPDERTTAFRNLATEANTQLSNLLTPAGAQAYKSRGGAWVRNLERPPPGARPVAPKG